jgi:hypothetical protein
MSWIVATIAEAVTGPTLKPSVVDKLKALRGHSESHSDVILRVAEMQARDARYPRTTPLERTKPLGWP